MANTRFRVDRDQLAAFCQRHRIRKLSLFGSVLRAESTPDSDIDVLVEFEPHAPVGFIGFCAIEDALSDLVRAKVDLNTPKSLSPRFREHVCREASVQFEA